MNDRRLRWMIVIAVGVLVTVLAFQPAAAGSSGFEAGRASGAAFGYGLIAAIATYFVLRFLGRRT